MGSRVVYPHYQYCWPMQMFMEEVQVSEVRGRFVGYSVAIRFSCLSVPRRCNQDLIRELGSEVD